MHIALSGLSGCGNTSVSRIVAESLGLTRFNHTFRDIAQEKSVPLEEIQNQAELRPSIDFELDKALACYALEHDDVIIASRLAVWLDDWRLLEKVGLVEKPRFDLKVWLEAPLECRGERIARRENKPIEKVIEETRKRDEQNERRYKALYGIDVSLSSQVPGIYLIHTENYSSATEVAQLICGKANKINR